MFRNSLFLRVGCLALACWPAGCGESNDRAIPTHIIFGRLTSTSVNPGGRDGRVKVVGPADGIQAQALYSGSCGFAGPNCEYRIHWVPEGNYTVFAFIDMNGNSVYELPSPDSGDLVTTGRALMLWDTTEVNFEDEAWREMP